MEAIELKELLKTREATFFLKSRDKNFTLKKLDIRGEEWIRVKFGKTFTTRFEIAQLMDNVTEFFELVYYLLKEKEEFLAVEGDFIDEKGVRVRRLLTGPEILMDATDSDELESLAEALLTVIGLSRPAREKLESEVKKARELQAVKT